jgi:hypothetical protein
MKKRILVAFLNLLNCINGLQNKFTKSQLISVIEEFMSRFQDYLNSPVNYFSNNVSLSGLNPEGQCH